jgi:hypothetical protein
MIEKGNVYVFKNSDSCLVTATGNDYINIMPIVPIEKAKKTFSLTRLKDFTIINFHNSEYYALIDQTTTIERPSDDSIVYYEKLSENDFNKVKELFLSHCN